MLTQQPHARCGMEPGYCPDPDELAEFATGNLHTVAFQRIAGHVERCGTCETALAALDDPADPLLSRLRQTALHDLPATEPVPHEFLTAARSCYGESSGPAGQNAA